VVGDIKQEEVLPKLSFLDKLPKKEINVPKPEGLPSYNGKTTVYIIDVPKSAQTEFRVGYRSGIQYDPAGDYYQAYLMNYPIGTGFTSRLNQMLRETKGWTYGARSAFNSDKYSGNFQFSSSIRADVTDSALMEVMRQLKDYRESGPTEEEVAFMKNAVSASEALNYETAFQKAAFIRRILEYDLSPDFVAQQNKILRSMTREQMLSLAKKYLDPQKLNILLVGDKAKIHEGVKNLGYEIVELDVDGNKVDGKKAF
jgi:zinc protease